MISFVTKNRLNLEFFMYRIKITQLNRKGLCAHTFRIIAFSKNFALFHSIVVKWILVYL